MADEDWLGMMESRGQEPTLGAPEPPSTSREPARRTGASTRLPWEVAALVGVLGVAAALAVGHLVAGVLHPNASPFLAVGNTAIDLAPAPVKEFAIRTFGTYDKVVLIGGMGVVLLGFAVIAGLLSRRSPWPGAVLAVVLGGLGVAAVRSRPDLGPVDLLAPAASLVVGVAVFRWLHGLAVRRRARSARSADDIQADDTGTDDSRADNDGGRRRFLIMSAGVAVGAGVAGGIGQLLAGRVDVGGAGVELAPLTPAVPAPPIPAGADFARLGTPTVHHVEPGLLPDGHGAAVPRVRGGGLGAAHPRHGGRGDDAALRRPPPDAAGRADRSR